jgi:hypothetical protein
MLTLKFHWYPTTTIELSFGITATIRTAKSCLAKLLYTIPVNLTLSYSGTVFENNCRLVTLGVPRNEPILVTVNFARMFRFMRPGNEPIYLPFRETATISDAKNALSPKFKVPPDRIVLSYQGRDLDDGQLMVNLELEDTHSIEVELPQQNEYEIEYMFLLEGEGHKIALSPNATVGDAIDEVTDRASPGIRVLSLSFAGRRLKIASQKLTELGLGKQDIIVAETKLLTPREVLTARQDDCLSPHRRR